MVVGKKNDVLKVGGGKKMIEMYKIYPCINNFFVQGKYCAWQFCDRRPFPHHLQCHRLVLANWEWMIEEREKKGGMEG